MKLISGYQRCGAAVLAFASFAYGQESLKTVDAIHFAARAFGNDYFEDIRFYDANGESVPLVMNPHARTPLRAIPMDETELRFFREEEDENGERVETSVAIADLSEVGTHAFIVFTDRPDIERELPYTVYVADESPENFQAGQLRFLNLAGPPILARVGQEIRSLQYGFGGDLRFDVDEIEEVPFELAVRVGEGWKVVYSTGFRPYPGAGALAILKPPRYLGSLELQVELRQRGYAPIPASEVEGPAEIE